MYAKSQRETTGKSFRQPGKREYVKRGNWTGEIAERPKWWCWYVQHYKALLNEPFRAGLLSPPLCVHLIGQCSLFSPVRVVLRMPELPEVETMRRGIQAAEGARVVSVKPSRCGKRPLKLNTTWPAISRALRDKTLEKVDRHGKRLILRFSGERVLVIEPRMTGLLVTVGEPDCEHLRFEMRLRGGRCTRIAYWDQRGLGQIFLFDGEGIDAYLSPEKIGPDALTITPRQLRENLGHRSVPIKVGLLDQKAIAGVGNIYASEILHLSGIDPRRPCSDLTPKQWAEIHKQMLIVLKSAIRYEGSTLRDGTWRNTLNDPGGYQNEHRVYDRAGQRCGKCRRDTVQRIVQAQRSTYFCGRCQNK